MLGSTTDVELLKAILSSGQPSAWPDFVKKYSRLLRRWCDRWGVLPADADEIIQNTLLEVFRKCHTYERDPEASFRAWLKTLARRQFMRYRKKQARHGKALPGERIEMLESDAAIFTDKAFLHYEELLSQIANAELVELACRNVRRRVSEDSWKIFCLREIDKMPAKDVAEELGRSVNAVNLVAFKVRNMLRVEFEAMDK